MQRIFIPGSEWLYFKLYTGHKSADDLLVGHLLPLGQKLKREKLIRDFFFIRYADPRFHIRFRMRVEDVGAYGAIFHRFGRDLLPCVENGMLWKVQCDTYQREVERYGEATIADVESLFCVDSESVIELIDMAKEGGTLERDRWKLALLMNDDLLEVFGFDLAAKKQLTENLSRQFKREFGFTVTAFNRQLNDKYRKNRQAIELVCAHEDPDMEQYGALLERRRDGLSVIARRILDLNGAADKPVSRDDLMCSILHMTMNRLFRSKNRINEMVVYDFMFRHYDSLAARLKYAN